METVKNLCVDFGYWGESLFCKGLICFQTTFLRPFAYKDQTRRHHSV